MSKNHRCFTYHQYDIDIS